MRWLIVLSIVGFLLPAPSPAYSVLTHEAIIDSSWPHDLRPLLLKRFPNVTEDQLREAHAYAYGGAIIQDMGYYPFGSKFFSDLVHYVRSGDFVLVLLKDAQTSGDLNDYAFALGALAHYAADNHGHPIAVNRTVPMVYPKLRAKFGPEVTYEDNPAAHLKTEFGFDVIEVARGQFADEAYHDFIGFKVAKPLLERAFEETYCIPLKELFTSLDLALGTYRFSISQAIPEMTKAAWAANKKDIRALQAGMTRRRYVYRLSIAQYQKDWDDQYQRPGFGARFLAFLFRLIPKVGPFKAFAFKVPPAAAETLFLASVGDTIRDYGELLSAASEDGLKLPNENFDTGQPTRRGDYHLADDTYAKLLERFDGHLSNISNSLGANILSFYGTWGSPDSDKAKAALAGLRQRTESSCLSGSTTAICVPLPGSD
ncbi:MAG: zinc dependent phospholipase C family protein [Acidobacteriaceae bacterium]|nr:zinc dependent phospholipase C family protein [Acidobacteriaceae bacterium]